MRRIIAILLLMIGLISCGGESPLTVDPPVNNNIFSCPETGYIENCMKCHGDE